MVLWIGPILRAVTGRERQRPGYNAYPPNTYQTPYAGQYPGPNPYQSHPHPHPHNHHHHHHQQTQMPVGYMVPVAPQPQDRWERKQARRADRLARKAERHGLPVPVVVAAPAPSPAPYGYDYGRPAARMSPDQSGASGRGNRAGDLDHFEPPAGPPPKSARGHGGPDRRASLDDEELGHEGDLPPSYESAVSGPSQRRSVEVLSSGRKEGRQC